MAKAATAMTTESGVPARALSIFSRSREFLKDVRSEMKKVVTPSRSEVQSTTIVVIISVFAFAGFFFVCDWTLGNAVKYLYHWLGAIQ
ncbi:MAG TPA: preprotein translocase subunit SecE [Acidobacteriaceae bacterium]|jgi:preprotein translocase subunit SecE|nr:preprotein translocase subunit SecE [Acidobacteriaceae bacterium]